LAIDQAHRQNNAVIKGDGGAIGLTEDPVALRMWMAAGPEVSRHISEYKATSEFKDMTTGQQHHEQEVSAQNAFLADVKKVNLSSARNGKTIPRRLD